MNLPRPYSLAAVQMRMTANRDENASRAAAFIREAASNGAQVVCLPELFLGEYFCQSEDAALFDLAEPIPGPATETFGALARELGVVIVVSLFEKRAVGLYHNTTVTLDTDGQIACVYRKMHIPDDPGFYEKFYFAPGDLGYKVASTSIGQIGTLICWDQWYPEAARLTALQGADVLVYPTAIGWHPDEQAELGAAQHDAWRTVQRGHAVANGVYVVAVNRIGHEAPAGGPGIRFWGQSFITDPFGAILAEAPVEEEVILYAPIDPARQEAIRRGWPFLRDRRIDSYGGLVSRFLD